MLYYKFHKPNGSFDIFPPLFIVVHTWLSEAHRQRRTGLGAVGWVTNGNLMWGLGVCLQRSVHRGPFSSAAFTPCFILGGTAWLKKHVSVLLLGELCAGNGSKMVATHVTLYYQVNYGNQMTENNPSYLSYRGSQCFDCPPHSQSKFPIVCSSCWLEMGKRTNLSKSETNVIYTKR